MHELPREFAEQGWADPQVSLEDTALFKGLPEHLLRRVAATGVTRAYRKAEVLFREGDCTEHLWILLEGEVELSFTSPTRPEKFELFITRVEPNQCFAWPAVAGHEHLATQATVKEDATVLLIPADELVAIMEEEPAFGYRIMRRLLFVAADRLNETRNSLRWLLDSV